MSGMDEYHFEVVGRILAHLIEHGLSRVDLDQSHATTLMTERRGNDDQAIKTFVDCLRWMEGEGLIRYDQVFQPLNSNRVTFRGVQLTSSGIARIKADPQDPEIGPTVEKWVTESKGELSAAIYAKIGAFVGGVLGGFGKSIGG